jgi:hypothetical protein
MPSSGGFQLQDRDIELLHSVHQLRIATIDHLSALSGRSVRSLWGRLHKLQERRYLTSVARFMQKHVYAIGSAGVPVLIEEGYAPEKLKDKRPRHRELTQIGIRHSLFIALDREIGFLAPFYVTRSWSITWVPSWPVTSQLTNRSPPAERLRRLRRWRARPALSNSAGGACAPEKGCFRQVLAILSGSGPCVNQKAERVPKWRSSGSPIRSRTHDPMVNR